MRRAFSLEEYFRARRIFSGEYSRLTSVSTSILIGHTEPFMANNPVALIKKKKKQIRYIQPFVLLLVVRLYTFYLILNFFIKSNDIAISAVEIDN